VVLGAVAGCGGSSDTIATGNVSQPPSSTTPSPTPMSATPKPELLFAVLEAHGGHGTFPLLDDTVAIVGTDGVARAKATFDVRARPVIGNAAPVLVPEARTAAGAVYYVDGHGTVRRLSVGSAPTTVATFSVISGQSEFSFAVGPDGQHLVASAFTFPPLGPPCSDPFCNPFTPGAPYKVDFQRADYGGAASSVRHEERPQDNNAINHVPMVAGWIDSGPLMTTDQVTGTQDLIGDRFWFGDVHRMDATGLPGAVLGGAGCDAFAALHDGTVACNNAQATPSLSVRAADGTVKWSASTKGFVVYLALAPDGNSAAVRTVDGGTTVLESVGGKTVNLPASFMPQGFLDANTLVGITVSGVGQQQGEMALVHADSPGALHDLGFVGSFVGVVQG
jgi:hypothetical protein